MQLSGRQATPAAAAIRHRLHRRVHPALNCDCEVDRETSPTGQGLKQLRQLNSPGIQTPPRLIGDLKSGDSSCQTATEDASTARLLELVWIRTQQNNRSAFSAPTVIREAWLFQAFNNRRPFAQSARESTACRRDGFKVAGKRNWEGRRGRFRLVPLSVRGTS